jgi:hypothetical protein
MMPTITQSEWARAAVLALVIVAVTSVPYALGFARSDTQHVYSGATLDRVDYNVYLATMQQGVRGSWRFSLTFTPEDHPGALVYQFYLFLGHVVRWTGWSASAVYQVARSVCALAMMLAMYVFIAALISARPLRWLAYVLACAGSGLGWLQLIVMPTSAGGISPIDFWLMDGFPFFGALTFPHFTASVALMALVFVGVLALFSRLSWRTAVWTALGSFALTVIHPFSGGLVILVASVYAALRVILRLSPWTRPVPVLGVLAAPAAPVLVYDTWLFSTQPVFRGWSQQNITLSPPPLHYLISYGLLIVLAIFGGVRLMRRRDAKVLLVLAWIVVVVPLLYAPTNLQRRFLEGVMLPLCVLASVGAVSVLRRLVRARQWRRRALLWLVALTLPSNLVLVAGASVASFMQSPSVFYPGDVIAAVDWLGANAGPDDVVLSSFLVGNLIPARTGRRVVLGHWIGTLDYATKTDQVRRFFGSEMSDEGRRTLLRDYAVLFVFVGPDERKLGDFDPAQSADLIEVFRSGDVILYRVKQP